MLSLCYQIEIGCPKQAAKKCQNDSADMASTCINTNFCEHVVCRFIFLGCFFRKPVIQAPDHQLVLRCQRLSVKAKHFLHAKFFALTAMLPCNGHTMEHRIPQEHPRRVQAREHKGKESQHHCLYYLRRFVHLYNPNEILSGGVGYPKTHLCLILRSSAFSFLITMLSKVSLVTAVTGSYAKCGTASHGETCPVD